ncbi:MAG: hypothetical protein CMM37_00165 [Rhodospirillaceae bacterium]|nr:hypothetical protein [Rhodospirillaceae bacterium]
MPRSGHGGDAVVAPSLNSIRRDWTRCLGFVGYISRHTLLRPRALSPLSRARARARRAGAQVGRAEREHLHRRGGRRLEAGANGGGGRHDVAAAEQRTQLGAHRLPARRARDGGTQPGARARRRAVVGAAVAVEVTERHHRIDAILADAQQRRDRQRRRADVEAGAKPEEEADGGAELENPPRRRRRARPARDAVQR